MDLFLVEVTVFLRIVFFLAFGILGVAALVSTTSAVKVGIGAAIGSGAGGTTLISSSMVSEVFTGDVAIIAVPRRDRG